MSTDRTFSSSKPFLAGFAILLAPAAACSGSDGFTESPDASKADDADSADSANLVANPDLGDAEASADNGTSLDAGGDVLCPTANLTCEGGCVPNDVHNCGACGNVCTPADGGMAACTLADGGSYACTTSCGTGSTLCGTSCVTAAGFQSDPNNCGTCRHSCLAGSCVGSMCESWTVAQLNAIPWATPFFRPPNTVGLATDGTYVAWPNGDAVGVSEIVVDGGSSITQVAPQTQGQVYQLFVAIADGATVWADWDQLNDVALVGGTRDGVAVSGPDMRFDMGAGVPGGIAMDPTGKTAYIAEDEADPSDGTTEEMWSCTFQPSPDCHLLFQLNSNANNLAVNSNYLAYTTANAVWTYQLSSNLPSSVAAEPASSPYITAIDSTYVYWAVSSGGLVTVKRTPLAGPPSAVPEVVVSNFAGAVDSISTDGKNLYFSANVSPDASVGSGVIAYAPVGGGSGGALPPAPTEIYTGDIVYGAVVGGGAIYWFDGVSNRIYGLAIP
jgi:hypothetical protein